MTSVSVIIDFVDGSRTVWATIDRAHNGPPNSAHGGYACAIFAQAASLPSPVAVTLLAAPPLERPLAVVAGRRRSTVYDGDRLIATVARAARGPTPVDAVDPATARDAAADFAGHTEHPFPTCFACGQERPDGTGLRLTPGPVPGRPNTVACLWLPSADDDALVWSVLDCPGGWTEPRRGPAVLTRFSVVITGRVCPGEPHVVVATRLGLRGRTVTVGSALYDGSGALVAAAAATWTSAAGGLDHGGAQAGEVST